jgi:hypothetical protein
MITILRCFLIIFLAVFVENGFCQEYITLSGRVSDQSTGTPLPFAQVSVKGTTTGTATNADGYFHLVIAAEHRGDTLMVYYLGYLPFQQTLSSSTGEDQVILLKPAAIQLSEVEIVGLTPQEVLRKAVQAIPANYGTDSVILTAFIRVRKMVNNRLAEFAEAIVEDQKDGYYLYKRGDMPSKYRKSNVPLLVKGRAVSDTSLVNSLGEVGRNAWCLSCYFVRDNVEFYGHTFMDEKGFGDYDYRMEEMTGAGGNKIYHIFFDQKDNVSDALWKGEVFITASGFAVEKIILKPSLKGFDRYDKKIKYQRTYTLRNKAGWIQDMPLGQTIITYSQNENKWNLNTIRNEYWMTYHYPPTGQVVKYSYKDDVVVTDVSRDPAANRNFRGDKSVGKNQRWDQVVGRVDESFWMNFNYLPIEESLLRSVEEIAKGK